MTDQPAGILDARNISLEIYRLKPGTPLADAERAAAVRDGFFSALLTDPRVVTWWKSWRHGVALEDAIRDAGRFVRADLDLPWPWVAYELLRERELDTRAVAQGRTHERPRFAARLLAPAPLAVHSDPSGTETVDEAVARLRFIRERCGLWIEWLRTFEAQQGNGHHAPRADDSYLRAWGRWYYERKVAQSPKTLYAIAKENRKTHKHVREAIRKAECLLSLLPGGKRRR